MAENGHLRGPFAGSRQVAGKRNETPLRARSISPTTPPPLRCSEHESFVTMPNESNPVESGQFPSGASLAARIERINDRETTQYVAQGQRNLETVIAQSAPDASERELRARSEQSSQEPKQSSRYDSRHLSQSERQRL